MHEDTVPCLLELTEEFDILGPKRDDASDGSIGDAAHKARSSNHNRDDTSGSATPQSDSDGEPDIRAVDIDDSGPFLNGFTMQKGVDLIVSRCRSGVENRLVEIIYNGKCWYKSNGWAQQTYTGSNKHDRHAHFGAKADTGKLENDRRPWGLVEKWGDDVTPDELLDYDDVPNLYGDKATNPNVQVRTALKAAVSSDVKLDDVLALLKKIDAKPPVDIDIDALAAAIVALLPPSALTYEGVKQAVSEVLLHGAAPAAGAPE